MCVASPSLNPDTSKFLSFFACHINGEPVLKCLSERQTKVRKKTTKGRQKTAWNTNLSMSEAAVKIKIEKRSLKISKHLKYSSQGEGSRQKMVLFDFKSTVSP